MRLHRAGHDPWWFSSDGTGRFDLIEEQRGTCYFAATPVGACLEVFRRGVVPASELHARVLSTVESPRPLRLADCTSKRARGFGITGEIHSTPHYEITQRWASALARAGFDGVLYLLRHDPSQRCRGIAVFRGAFAALPRPTTQRTVSDEELVELARDYGVFVR